MKIDELMTISMFLDEAYSGQLYKNKVAIDPNVSLKASGQGQYHWTSLPTGEKLQLLNKMYATGQKLRNHIIELKRQDAEQKMVSSKTGKPVFADGELDKLTGRLLSGFKQINALLRDITDEIKKESESLNPPH